MLGVLEDSTCQRFPRVSMRWYNTLSMLLRKLMASEQSKVHHDAAAVDFDIASRRPGATDRTPRAGPGHGATPMAKSLTRGIRDGAVAYRVSKGAALTLWRATLYPYRNIGAAPLPTLRSLCLLPATLAADWRRTGSSIVADRRTIAMHLS